jgi:catechol 2,3-dioxygenase-like lactoylglutathione lyase family enzyme
MQPNLNLHHVGLVVTHLEIAVEWTTKALGFNVLFWEPETEVDGEALGLPDTPVRLRGALMAPGVELPTVAPIALELHEFYTPTSGPNVRSTHTLGLGHIAFRAVAIDPEMQRLASLGVAWNGRTPVRIAAGPYKGRRWIYGVAPPLAAVIELLQEPRI